VAMHIGPLDACGGEGEVGGVIEGRDWSRVRERERKMSVKKKEKGKRHKYFAAYGFFLYQKTFYQFDSVRWGSCERYRDVFRCEVFSIVLVLPVFLYQNILKVLYLFANGKVLQHNISVCVKTLCLVF
jgi:hypothetical protein